MVAPSLPAKGASQPVGRDHGLHFPSSLAWHFLESPAFPLARSCHQPSLAPFPVSSEPCWGGLGSPLGHCEKWNPVLRKQKEAEFSRLPFSMSYPRVLPHPAPGWGAWGEQKRVLHVASAILPPFTAGKEKPHKEGAHRQHLGNIPTPQPPL